MLAAQQLNEDVAGRPARLPETRVGGSRPFRRPCIRARRAASARSHQGNRPCVRPAHGGSTCFAQGANGAAGDSLGGKQFASNQEGVVLNDAGGGDGFWSDYVQVRPENGDGYLTLGEAKWQWQRGEGAPVTVDANKLDFSGLRVSDFPQGPGSTQPFALTRWRDFIVHGTVTTELTPNAAVSVRVDTFNFDLKPWSGHVVRNIYTLTLRAYVGPGTPYNVHFRGTAPIAP